MKLKGFYGIMEFTNEIFFNKKLIQGETVLITYSGKLYKEYSSEIAIVYGFGDNWDYTQETKMQEKENGFEALITLKDYNTFNFCFKNNYNIWDNNSGFNYIATVDAAPKIEDKTNNSENTDNTPKAGTSVDSSETQIDQTEEPVDSDETVDIEDEAETTEGGDSVNNSDDTAKIEQDTDNQKSDDYIEKAFSDLLDSILQFNQENLDQNVNLDNGFGLQSVDKVNEISEVDVNVNDTDFISCDDIFQKMYEELTAEQSNTGVEENTEEISNSEVSYEPSNDFQEATTQDDKNNTNPDLESLLNDISVKEDKEEKHQPITAEELDSLMENILNSIVEDESKEDNIQKNESTNSDESNLPVVQAENQDFLDVFIDKSISFFGSIWKACKKVGTLIKEAAKDLFTEND